MSSFKRPRSPQNYRDSPSPSSTPSPTLKAARTSATPPPPGVGEPSTSSGHILCTLPPTCNAPNRPTPLANTRELEAHYAMYHAHVCEEKGCGCVFPDARLLELHQTECHDPLAAVRRERGEKIFACHLASCTRHFSSPKTRRLHLIQAHGYPKEYFFAVTNKGVGGLLKRWGEGASLLRRPWRPRENGAADEDDEDDDATGMEAEQTGAEVRNAREETTDDEDEILLEKMPMDRPATATTAVGANGQAGTGTASAKGKAKAASPPEDVDALANSMDALSLVPSSIQFGRGAKRGALQSARGRVVPGHVSRGRGGRGRGIGGPAVARMELDPHIGPGPRGRGRGDGRTGPPFPRGGLGMGRGFVRGRGQGTRGFIGPHRGEMLGPGNARGMGPGRGVSKGSVRS